MRTFARTGRLLGGAHSRIDRSNPLRRRGLPLVLALSAAACGSSEKSTSGSSNPEVLSDLTVVATPPGGEAFYTPIFTIQPGQDITYCTYMEGLTDKDRRVHTTTGTQSKFGHHAIIFYATAPEKPHTAECYGEGMVNLHQMLGATGGEGNAFWEPPANVSTLVPKGSQMVIQSHWINTVEEPTRVQAMMVTIPGKTGPDAINAGSVAIVDTTFKIPPQGPYETFTECTFDRPHDLIMSLGHEHEWGTHVFAEVTRTDGTTETLLDRPFVPHDTFAPPVDDHPLATPLKFAMGDKLRMTCQWENTTTDALQFPREMCVFFGYSMEPEDAHCVDGRWDHNGASNADAGPPSAMACAPPGTPGNELKVGEYCTQHGGQCTDNKPDGGGNSGPTYAIICGIDFGGPAYCTMPCTDTSQCGSGTVCTNDTPGGPKGCAPVACLLDAGAP